MAVGSVWIGFVGSVPNVSLQDNYTNVAGGGGGQVDTNEYTVPTGYDYITKWKYRYSVFAATGSIKLKVLRPVSGSSYDYVNETPWADYSNDNNTEIDLGDGSLAVQSGDRIGFYTDITSFVGMVYISSAFSDIKLHTVAGDYSGDDSVFLAWNVGGSGAYTFAALCQGELGSSYTRELTETLASAESKFFQPQQYLTFSPTLSDSLVKDGSTIRVESMSLAESVAAGLLVTQTLNELLSLSDSLSKQTQKSITESISIAETLVKDISTIKVETLTIIPSIQKQATKMLAEALSTTDSLSNVTTFVRQLSETLNIDESLVRSFLKIKELSEALAFVESVAGETFPGITLTEQMSIQENFQRIKTFANKLVADFRRLFGDDISDTFNIPKQIFGDDIKRDKEI